MIQEPFITWITKALNVIFWLVILGIIFLTLYINFAYSHEAIPTAAKPEGWSYPYSCCSGYDCRPVGYKKPLPKGDGVFITEDKRGYIISTTNEVIPVTDGRVKESPDGTYHWCSVAGEVTGRTICLYVPPRSY